MICYYCGIKNSCKWGWYDNEEACYPCVMYFRKNPRSTYLITRDRPRRKSPDEYKCCRCDRIKSSCWYRSTQGHICETCYRRDKRQRDKMSEFINFDQ
jgi:hypothetical protein